MIVISVLLFGFLLQDCAGLGVTISDVRLANGSTQFEGRVEVLINGSWGIVCDDGWDDLEAQVICSSLHYRGGTAFKNAHFGPGNGIILVDDVSCHGDEAELGDCYFSTQENCEADEAASVVCLPDSVIPPISTTTVKPGVNLPDNCFHNNSNVDKRVLLFGSVPGMGYVMVSDENGTFGFVCDDGWDTNAAKVVCGELCYRTTLTEPGISAMHRVNVSTPQIALDDVYCSGFESSLVDCQHADWSNHDCSNTELAAVTCVPVTYSTLDDPEPILQCREGDLIALFNKSRDPNLEAKFLSVYNASCPQFLADDTDQHFISAKIPYASCGTGVEQNNTHIIYSNAIFIESTTHEGHITRSKEYIVKLVCVMPRNATARREVESVVGVVTRVTHGNFVIGMTLYEDFAFSEEVKFYPHRVHVGDWLNAAVHLDSVDSNLKLVVTDCDVKASAGTSSVLSRNLITDKCATEEYVEILPLSQQRLGIRWKAFSFINHPLLNLECKTIVCLKSEVTKDCDRSCDSAKPDVRRRRRKRDAVRTVRDVYWIQSPPFVLTEPRVHPSGETMTPYDALGRNTTEHSCTVFHHWPDIEIAVHSLSSTGHLEFNTESQISVPTMDTRTKTELTSHKPSSSPLNAAQRVEKGQFQALDVVRAAATVTMSSAALLYCVTMSVL